MIVLLLLLLQISNINAQECPVRGKGCVDQSGFKSLPSNSWQICTVSINQLHSALSCLNRCNLEIPAELQADLKTIDDTCSRMENCENYNEKFTEFKKCYESEDDFKDLIEHIINLFNARLPHNSHCLKLRKARSCMRSFTRECPYLDYFYNNHISSHSHYDLALFICGAEGVEARNINDGCSQGISNRVERSCGVACDLASAPTAGDFCTTLQRQTTCLERQTQRCTEAQSNIILPRLSSLSFINNLFLCNISLFGVVVKPIDYNQCNFKKVLKMCFDVNDGPRLSYKDVQKIMNNDFLSNNFCNKSFEKQRYIQECTKTFWACLSPLSRALPKPQTPYSFFPSIGTFPLDHHGLHYAFDSCFQPPAYSPVRMCANPAYDLPRQTTVVPSYLQG